MELVRCGEGGREGGRELKRVREGGREDIHFQEKTHFPGKQHQNCHKILSNVKTDRKLNFNDGIPPPLSLTRGQKALVTKLQSEPTAKLIFLQHELTYITDRKAIQ